MTETISNNQFSLNISGINSVITRKLVLVNNSRTELIYYQDGKPITKDKYLKYKHEFEK